MFVIADFKVNVFIVLGNRIKVVLYDKESILFKENIYLYKLMNIW